MTSFCCSKYRIFHLKREKCFVRCCVYSTVACPQSTHICNPRIALTVYTFQQRMKHILSFTCRHFPFNFNLRMCELLMLHINKNETHHTFTSFKQKYIPYLDREMEQSIDACVSSTYVLFQNVCIDFFVSSLFVMCACVCLSCIQRGLNMFG